MNAPTTIKVQLVSENTFAFQSRSRNFHSTAKSHLLKQQLISRQLLKGTRSVKGVSNIPSDEPAAQTQGLQAHAMQGSAAIVNDVWRGGMPTLGQDQEVSTQLFSHVGPVSCRHVWCVSKAEVHGGAPICKVHFGSLEGID
jgi:hypothetical protein